MMSNRLAFGALAAACITAAAGGGYLATRQATLTTEAAAPAGRSQPGEEIGASGPGDDVSLSSAGSTSDKATAIGQTPPADAIPQATRPADHNRGARVTAKTKSPVARDAASSLRATPGRERNQGAATAAGSRPAAGDTTSVAAVEPSPAAAVSDNRLAGGGPPAPLDATALSPVNTATPAAVDPPSFEEFVIQANAVIGLELERGLSSDRSRVEQVVEARVVRDVRVGGRVVVPAGTQAIGSVMVVERGGRFKERARLGIAFQTLVLPDGTRTAISTETIYRYGDAPGDKSAKKIGGGAVAGAILGAIIGGAKGAAVGATAGAGGGTAMVMAGERSAAEFPAGADVTARILEPVTVTLETLER